MICPDLSFFHLITVSAHDIPPHFPSPCHTPSLPFGVITLFTLLHEERLHARACFSGGAGSLLIAEARYIAA